ncbi:MAG: UDP-N-acetylmuramoyl-tripeptide--D-alanyl-D-alanine ligase [Bdellovibrionales bacterium]|nr:UDP-N-acetylmuramoyl-tripeptide--D-alanyl-D-alanine ligase [Bdellovibrionales bacterium]
MTKYPLRVDVNLSLDYLGRVFNDAQILSLKIPHITGVCLDSRAILPGDLFFALKGERDGHRFVEDALEKGARAVVVSENVTGKGISIKVKDTYAALVELASCWRTDWGKKIIAITGSNGKTTTKEIIYSILSAHVQTIKSPGTWNNHLGIPLTLLMIKNSHELAVLEMGMNHQGEIENYCQIAKPDIGVITNIGHAHIGELGSIEAIARAKAELFENLSSHGTAIVNLDDPRIEKIANQIKVKKIYVSMKPDRKADISLTKIGKLDSSRIQLNIKYGESILNLCGPFGNDYSRANLICALGVALICGVPHEVIQTGIDQISWPDKRYVKLTLGRGITLIDDTYNANPDSMKGAIKAMCEEHPGRKIVLLGDMKELGSYSRTFHQEVGRSAFEQGVNLLFAIGEFAKDYASGAINAGMKSKFSYVFTDRDEMLVSLMRDLQRGDTLLVKGSRGSQMEYFSEALKLKLPIERNR